MKYLFTIFFLFSSLFCSVVAVPPSYAENTRDLLRMLDREVASYQHYEQLRQQRIDSLKALPARSAATLYAIAEENRKFNLDSALVYYRLAKSAAASERHDSLATVAQLRYASLLPASGYFSEAEKEFDAINPASLSEPLLAEYYKAGNQLFFYAAHAYNNREFANAYARRGGEYTDSLLRHLDPSSMDFLYYRAQQNMLHGDRTLAMADISEILSKCDETDDIYAIAASMASYYYTADPSTRNHRIYTLVLSALSDIKSGRREMTALQELGKTLYEQGDIERADRYLQLALEQTLKSDARMRIIESADLLPVLTRATQSKVNARANALVVMSLAMGVAVLVILFLLIRVYRSREKLKSAKQDIAGALKLRDLHIRNVLAFCSECMNRLEHFNRVASRKIKANQTAELHEMILSGKLVHDEFSKFLDTFDATFLSNYPDFINEVNALMQPDKRYAEPADHRLSPELRIIAFIRLGIDDSGTIAKMLDLSVNTVYTYRNKIKNRALDRETFEQKIKISPLSSI